MPRSILDGFNALVVDDDRLVMRSMARILRTMGVATVYEAASLDAAIGTVATSPVDVAFIDLALGSISGLTVMTALRQTRPELPMLLVTGGPVPDELPEGVVVLRKPFTHTALASAVEEQLATHSESRRSAG
ncbi:MAG: response regulator [Polyangiaceae bacterium]